MRFDYICKYAKNKGDQLLRAPSSVSRYKSTRVDEGRKCWILLGVKTRHVPKLGGRRRARYVTPVLSYYWEGARE